MGFERNLAWVIGIDAYSGGVSPLRTAVEDARAVAEALESLHDYDVTLLTDGDATGAALLELFTSTLPATVSADDRLLVYFAGHGIAQDGDDGPEGFLVPVDARADDRSSLVSMVAVQRALDGLPCRHLLLVLDCCFSGSFRWASTRSFLPTSAPLTRKRYQRFLEDPAWQVLTSSADDQKALDVLDGLTIGERPVSGEHSPFAAAFLDGLRGNADRPGADGENDGVVTAAELYGHVRDVVELGAEEQGKTQTPGLWPLPRHGRGEFLFQVPGAEPNLRPDPVLDEAANPWRGLAPYEAEHRSLFFGRDRVVRDLLARLLDTDDRFVAVFGASGTGKSSVVKAGLLPILEHEHGERFELVGPLRPGTNPLQLRDTLRAHLAPPSDRVRLVVLDQFEEVWTMCRDQEHRDAFLQFLTDGLQSNARWRLLVTARSDFSPQIANSPLGPLFEPARFVVPAFTADELRSIVTGPAQVRVLYFEPPELVDTIVEEVHGVPGALPLLSFTLAELYREYIRREADDRALIGADHAALGGVVGALRTRASELHSGYDTEHQEALRNVMLRLVATPGGELAKRRAFVEELAMNPVADTVVGDFVQARLFVKGSVGDGDAARGYVEPAHDMLVIAWDQVHAWMDDHGDSLPLLRRLWPAAWEWHVAGADKPARPLLWIESPYLPTAHQLLEAPSTLLNGIERAFVARSYRRKTARRTGLLVLVAAIGLTLLGLAGGALFYATQATQRAKEAREQSKRASDIARVVLAEQREGEPELGIAILREADPATPGWMRAATLLTNAATPLASVRMPPSHRDGVDTIRFAPGPRIYLGAKEQWVVWTPRDRNAVQPVDAVPDAAMPSVATSDGVVPDGLLADGEWWVRRAPSGEICGGGGHHASADGAWIVDTEDLDRVVLLRRECRAARPDVITRRGYGEPIHAWTLAADGRLYLGMETMAVAIDTATLEELQRYGEKEFGLVGDVFEAAEDGARFRDADNHWGVRHDAHGFSREPLLPTRECTSMAWSEDRRTLALACRRGHLFQAAGPIPVEDLGSLAIDRSFADGDGWVRRVRLDPDGSHLLSLSAGGGPRNDSILSIRRVQQHGAPRQLWVRSDEIASIEDDGRRVTMLDTDDGIVELLDSDPNRVVDGLWARTWACPTLEQRRAWGLDGDAEALDAACWENARR